MAPTACKAARTAYVGPLEVRSLGQGGQIVMAYPAGAVRLTAANNTWAPAFLHKDHLGSVRAISGPGGAVEERTLYRPYGAQSEVVTATLNDDKSWLGERYDAGAGLQYLNARYYDPELAMFLQPDWFEVMQAGVGTNRYSYSFGDPVNGSDRNGNYVDQMGMYVPSGPAEPGFAFDPTKNIGTVAMMAMTVGTTVAAAASPVTAAVLEFTALADCPPCLPPQLAGLGATSKSALAGVTVRGSAQVTRGADGAAHAARSVEMAEQIVKEVGPENVAGVYFHSAVKTALPGVNDARKPDVMVVLKDGRVIMVEVRSASQRIEFLEDKLAQITAQIQKQNPGTKVTTRIVEKSDDSGGGGGTGGGGGPSGTMPSSGSDGAPSGIGDVATPDLRPE